jgi:hypothetical protein
LADKSRALIWEIGDRLRQMEERWTLSEDERRSSVHGTENEMSSGEFRKAKALASLNRLVASRAAQGASPRRCMGARGGCPLTAAMAVLARTAVCADIPHPVPCRVDLPAGATGLRTSGRTGPVPLYDEQGVVKCRNM